MRMKGGIINLFDKYILASFRFILLTIKLLLTTEDSPLIAIIASDAAEPSPNQGISFLKAKDIYP